MKAKDWIRCPKCNRVLRILSDFDCWQFYCITENCGVVSDWYSSSTNAETIKIENVKWLVK